MERVALERMASRDTIAAIATPPGTGGVGIVRVSGPESLAIAAGLAGRSPDDLPCREMRLATIRSDDGEALDQVLVVAMRGPRSFTGEDVAEIHGHGGVANMAGLLRAALDRGARAAEPGEFTRRALENGRLDVLEAEAILGVIEAGSERAVRLGQAQLRGELGREIRRLRSGVQSALALVEASIDFPEEGLELPQGARLGDVLAPLVDGLTALTGSFDRGRALVEGITVAIVGPVNAGKSSLLNALLGRERALVADTPGTTRDYLEERASWDGVLVTLIDTAGLRDEAKGLELRGISLGQERSAEADVEVVLVPPEGPTERSEVPPEGSEVPPVEPSQGSRRIMVASKGDLMSESGGDDLRGTEFRTSALTGEGLDVLRRAILDRVLGSDADAAAGAVVTTERQYRELALALTSIVAAQEGAHSLPPEVVSVELRSVEGALSRCLGEELGDEVLDELFARFCIGK